MAGSNFLFCRSQQTPFLPVTTDSQVVAFYFRQLLFPWRKVIDEDFFVTTTYHRNLQPYVPRHLSPARLQPARAVLQPVSSELQATQWQASNLVGHHAGDGDHTEQGSYNHSGDVLEPSFIFAMTGQKFCYVPATKVHGFAGTG